MILLALADGPLKGEVRLVSGLGFDVTFTGTDGKKYVYRGDSGMFAYDLDELLAALSPDKAQT